MVEAIHSINRTSLIITWLYFRKVIAMDHDLNLEEMLAGGNMEEFVVEENLEEIGSDNSE